MTEKEVLRAVMKATGTTQAKLAEKLGLPNQTYVGHRLTVSKTIKVSTLLEFITAMDFEIVVRNKDRSIAFILDGKSES